MISEVGGLEFDPRSCISLCVIILIYRSTYDRSRVAQNSGVGALTDT
jgi:hypothetical protein